MFNPSEFKEGDKVVLYMESIEGQVDLQTHARVDHGDIVAIGDIEHVWTEKENRDFSTDNGATCSTYGLVFNIRAHSQDAVWVSKEKAGQDKPTFFTVSVQDLRSMHVWVKHFNETSETLFQHLKEVLANRAKLRADLIVENAKIRELLK